MPAKFVVHHQAAKGFHFTLISANGRVVASSLPPVVRGRTVGPFQRGVSVDVDGSRGHSKAAPPVGLVGWQ